MEQKNQDKALHRPEDVRATYKIEVIFSRHRSSLPHRSSPCMVLVWESGKHYHGGGDQKMYWCGYPDCDKPISSDSFGYMHAVCPHCNRELFLDQATKEQHVRSGMSDPRSLGKIPVIVGERLARLTPSNLAELLTTTWYKLCGDADIYLKYSPYEIRYDPKFQDKEARDSLDLVRRKRRLLIYPLKNIVKDLSAGAELKKRLLAMITN